MSDRKASTVKTIEVTDSELKLLEALWHEGPQTIRQLADAIYPRGTAAEYSSVQKLLDRLAVKGCVRRIKEKPAHRFEATMSREALIGNGLESLAAKLCQGSLAPLLVHLTEKVDLSDTERQVLQDLINQSEETE